MAEDGKSRRQILMTIAMKNMIFGNKSQRILLMTDLGGDKRELRESQCQFFMSTNLDRKSGQQISPMRKHMIKMSMVTILVAQVGRCDMECTNLVVQNWPDNPDDTNRTMQIGRVQLR
jgi:hypothetical protein